MQEIAILLSSIAGVVTAAAVRRRPAGRPRLLSLGASSSIKSQINTLRIERDLLAKTISRLYQDDIQYSKIQRDRLLSKYQHQMGMILARLEKMEQAAGHPDLGPVGDGLITLMDQKLSRLDDRLYELSSKIVTAGAPQADMAQPEAGSEPKAKSEGRPAGRMKGMFDFGSGKAKPSKTRQETGTDGNAGFDFGQKTGQSGPRQKMELTTLTSIPQKPQAAELQKPQGIMPQQVPKPATDTDIPKHKAAKQKSRQRARNQRNTQSKIPDLGSEVARVNRYKALPAPKTAADSVPQDDYFDDETDDIDKIKSEIKNALSRLDQAEVE